MLNCDRCGKLLALLKVHKKRAFCDHCKAWIAWIAVVD